MSYLGICFSVRECNNIIQGACSHSVLPVAMSLTNNDQTNRTMHFQIILLFFLALLQIWIEISSKSFVYFTLYIFELKDAGNFNTVTSLEHAGMLSWEDLARLTERLRQIKYLNPIKLLTECIDL